MQLMIILLKILYKNSSVEIISLINILKLVKYNMEVLSLFKIKILSYLILMPFRQ